MAAAEVDDAAANLHTSKASLPSIFHKAPTRVPMMAIERELSRFAKVHRGIERSELVLVKQYLKYNHRLTCVSAALGGLGRECSALRNDVCILLSELYSFASERP